MAPKQTCECEECSKCKHRAYMRDWYARNAERHRETARQSKIKNAERVRTYNRNWWREHGHLYRKQIRARNAVNHAIEHGRLERGPCERAHEGTCRGRIEGHHNDYEKLLEVRWFCSKHHGELDQRF